MHVEGMASSGCSLTPYLRRRAPGESPCSWPRAASARCSHGAEASAEEEASLVRLLATLFADVDSIDRSKWRKEGGDE